MSDLIDRQTAIDALWKALYEYEDKTEEQFLESEELDIATWFLHRIFVQNMSDIDRQTILNLPSVQPWIPVTERLPKNREWVLGVFQEGDTGWINPIPFICDYVGTKTPITTQDNWLLKMVDEPHPYYEKLHCIAWMPLPEPYREEIVDAKIC